MRLGRLEWPRPGDGPPIALRAMASEVAAKRGLDPAEVREQAGVLWRQAAEAGALGNAEDLARFLKANRWTAWRG